MLMVLAMIDHAGESSPLSSREIFMSPATFNNRCTITTPFFKTECDEILLVKVANSDYSSCMLCLLVNLYCKSLQKEWK